MKRILILLLSVLSFELMAAKPSCSSNHGGYCSYKGPVKHIYVNSYNLILIYFDTPLDLSEASVAGFTPTKGPAAALLITDQNRDFANLLYSTALAAQASKRNISIQMRGTQSGYLKVDRIWLAE